jgi:hypothetical protein
LFWRSCTDRGKEEKEETGKKRGGPKVRLYMDQMKDRADTLPVDDAEELPFD